MVRGDWRLSPCVAQLDYVLRSEATDVIFGPCSADDVEIARVVALRHDRSIRELRRGLVRCDQRVKGPRGWRLAAEVALVSRPKLRVVRPLRQLDARPG